MFITEEIFIDYFTDIILFFQYNLEKKIFTYVGSYKNTYIIKQILKVSIQTDIQEGKNSKIKTAHLYLYGDKLIGKLTIPLIQQ